MPSSKNAGKGRSDRSAVEPSLEAITEKARSLGKKAKSTVAEIGRKALNEAERGRKILSPRLGKASAAVKSSIAHLGEGMLAGSHELTGAPPARKAKSNKSKNPAGATAATKSQRPKLPKYSLQKNKSTERWELLDADHTVVKAFDRKADALKGGALERAVGGRGSVRIKLANGRIQSERTFPRSADPTRSKG